VTFEGATGVPAWEEALVALVKDGKVRKIELHRVDGVPAAQSTHAERLRAAGFVDGYRGLVYRS
jgi:hypothetical protein